MVNYVRYREGEWSALYVDGKLVSYGDHYYVDDWISAHLGIEEIESDDFLAADGRTVFDTLAEVHKKQDAREKREIVADELRSRAKTLKDQANVLLEQAKRMERPNA